MDEPTGHMLMSGRRGNRRAERLDGNPETSRSPSRGRSFVYVFPCRGEEILKLGFSRDPLERLQTLHPRYFEFFDLERAFLIHADHVKDAMRLERQLAKNIVLYNAPAPLAVPGAAAGHTEWYRGAYAILAAEARVLEIEGGYTLCLALKPWICARLEERAGLLYAWADGLLQAIHAWQLLGAVSGPNSLERVLRNALDAYAAVGLDPSRWVSAPVWRWYLEPPIPIVFS